MPASFEACSSQRIMPGWSAAGTASAGQASSPGFTQYALALVRSVELAGSLTTTVGTLVVESQRNCTVRPSAGTLNVMLALPPPSP